jgi:hypothetical protein
MDIKTQKWEVGYIFVSIFIHVGFVSSPSIEWRSLVYFELRTVRANNTHEAFV